jgi:hypothetical protein
MTTLIEVNIRSNSNIQDGTSNTVVVETMTLNVDSSGAFAGNIMPAIDNSGNLLPAIVFRGSEFYPDSSAPSSLNVSDQ